MMHAKPEMTPPRAGQAGTVSDQVGVELRIEGRVNDLPDLERGAEPMRLLNNLCQAFGLGQPHPLALKRHPQKAGMLKFAKHFVDLLAARFSQVSHENPKISMWQH